MTTPEFKIGERIEDSEGYGTVIVKDIFRSVTNLDWFCYRVELADCELNTSYLTSEEELFPASPQ